MICETIGEEELKQNGVDGIAAGRGAGAGIRLCVVGFEGAGCARGGEDGGGEGADVGEDG